jgi:hypothetical protein
VNKLITASLTAALVAAASPAALAQGNSANAPGHDRVCLVETGTPGSWRDVDIVRTKWLPRKAAEAQASKDPDRLDAIDYSDDPLVGTQYASAEELCKEHFD